MIGTTFTKPVADWAAYAQVAQWCNSNGAKIVEHDNYYEVVGLPEPSFDETKQHKRYEIAAARYEAETGGCSVNGITIATDRGSQSLLTAAVVTARLDPEFTVRWKCADNHFETLNSVQLKAIGDAVTAHIESCFAREADLCEQIDAAQTPEELAAIQWSL